MGSSYETIYGVGLLDDIHNYFPALLYEPSTFSSVRDVLTYVQSQTRSRFDLFSVGTSSYYSQEPLRPAAAAPRPAAGGGLAGVGGTRATSPATTLRSGLSTLYRINTYYDDMFVNNTFLSALLRGIISEGTAPPMTPVIVRPSPEQIAARTTESTYDGNLIEPPVCSICQDVLQAQDTTRQINHCQHLFHKNCVDVWFQSNVRCPVCRHDIRDS